MERGTSVRVPLFCVITHAISDEVFHFFLPSPSLSLSMIDVRILDLPVQPVSIAASPVINNIISIVQSTITEY